MIGALALVGGGEWADGADFDAELLESSGDREVVVVPTAAAYERPGRAIQRAESWFAALGATVVCCPLLGRSDAGDPVLVAQLAEARFVYLCGGSPLHLRSVLKDSSALAALVGAWASGAVVAGAGEAAMALSDPMVDPRGGAFTVGLGLVRNLAVVPHFDGEVSAQLRRTLALAPSGCPVVAVPDAGALLRSGDGSWSFAGAGAGLATIYVDGEEGELTDLAGKPAGWSLSPPR